MSACGRDACGASYRRVKVCRLTFDSCGVRLDAGDEPFEALVPGGKSGEFYDEMCNYFYLAQLRAQVRAWDISETASCSVSIVAAMGSQELSRGGCRTASLNVHRWWQGEDSTEEREITGRVPIHMVPDVLCVSCSCSHCVSLRSLRMKQSQLSCARVPIRQACEQASCKRCASRSKT